MSADFEQRLRARLDPLDRIDSVVTRSDRDLNPDWQAEFKELRDAAVLAPVIRRHDSPPS